MLVGASTTITAEVSAQRSLGYRAAGDLADEGAPDVLVSMALAANARSEVAVAGMYPNPQISFGQAINAGTWAQVYIALPIFGQVETARDAAAAQSRVARAGADVARVDARYGVGLTWVDLWLAQAELRVAIDTVTRRDRILGVASARFEEGAGPRIDIVRARAEAERARAEVEALALQVDAASSRIAVLVAPSRGNASFRAEGDAPMPDVPAAAEVLARLGEHPLAERAGLEVEAADAVVTRQHRARWPLIYLQTQATMWEQYGPPTEDFNVQLGFDLPIFDEPLITRAETQRATAQIARDALAAQLRGAALGARSDYLAAHTRATAQLEHALPAAREASELSREAYTAGGLDLTATLLAEQMRADAELSAAQAIAALGTALATLEHALGRPL